MKKVIVSKEECLHCLYGVTGECEMYDEMGKPMDGETCSNYEEAGEDEMAEGERLANGEITINDCIAYLTEQQEFHDPLSASGRRIQKSISYLREYKEQMNIWHKADDHPNNRHPYPVIDPDTQEMAFAYYDQRFDQWEFDRSYNPGRNMLWLDIEKILQKKEDWQ